MGFARKLATVLLGYAALFVIDLSAQAASPSTELKNMFAKMDRQLCKSLSLATCKRSTRQKRKPAKIGKAVAVEKSEVRKAKPVKSKPVKAAVVKPVPEQNDRVPLPVLKPAKTSKDKIAIPAPVIVLPENPPPKMPEVKVVILPAPVVPPPQPVLPPVHAMPEGTPQGEACHDNLAQLGVEFSRLSTSVGTGACSVRDAVKLRSMTIAGDVLKLPDQPTLTCGFALKFAGWIRQEADPAVKKATGTKIAALGTGPGLVCRGRNGDSSGKMSEHAFGNAVDIERLKLADGETIDIKDATTIGAKYQPVLATLRATACLYFTTVLGPGANEAHASHLHLDLAVRGRKGNHTLCQ